MLPCAPAGVRRRCISCGSNGGNQLFRNCMVAQSLMSPGPAAPQQGPTFRPALRIALTFRARQRAREQGAVVSMACTLRIQKSKNLLPLLSVGSTKL